MHIDIGFSPCPNDTFILHAMLNRQVPTKLFQFEEYISDVEELNQMALTDKLDITKMSFHAYLTVKENYRLMDSGAALGFGCGPLIIAREPLDESRIDSYTFAVPGKLTTANMLFRMCYSGASDIKFMVFSDIENAVLNGQVDAGVIIHENRFTYADKGLVCIRDLGEWWEELTGTPIPLGAFAIKRSLGEEIANDIETILAASVQFAMDHPTASEDFVRAHAQEMDPAVMQKHIATYVNNYSISLGKEGHAAVRILEERALAAGIIQ